MNKKAQITIVIIIGIVILFSTLMISYIRGRVKGADVGLVMDKVPSDIKPVQLYVVNCLEQVSQEAIIKLGEHGGYVEINNPKINNKNFKTDALKPTDSDGVIIANNHFIPYWWYLESPFQCADCIVSSKNIPTLEEMQQQINNYIQVNLDACINKFEDFKKQNYNIEVKDIPVAESLIRDGDIVVKLKYPISVSKTATSNPENFYVKIPVNLKKMHELATIISILEAETQLYDNFAMNIVALYSALDENKLPPIAGITDGYSFITWSKSATEQRFKDLLTTNLPMLQYENTKDAVHIKSTRGKYEQGMFDSVFIKGIVEKYPFKVDSMYFNWPIYLDITPSKGDLLAPQSTKYKAPFNIYPTQQKNEYSFYYDIAYPVIIQIEDKNAFNNKGYKFLFAIEANIRDNKNLLLWHQGRGTAGVSTKGTIRATPKGEVPTEFPTSFDPATNKTLMQKIRMPSKTLFCNEEQRLSGETSITVYNKETKQTIDDVGVTFGCGTYITCLIGTTKDGSFISKLPLCEGGYLQFEKSGYGTASIPLSTQKDAANNLNVELTPLKKLNIKIKAIELLVSSNKAVTTGKESDIDFNKEKLILTISKDTQTVLDAMFTSSIILDKDNQNAAISLMPGSYSVNAMLMDNEGVKFPAQTQKIGGKEFKIDEMNLKPFMSGGVDINKDSGLFVVKESGKKKNNEITFYVFRAPKPKSIEDMSTVNNIGLFSKVYRTQIEPVFS